MTANPTCCVPDDTVDRVAQMMKSENVGSIPVVENWNSKKVVGVITDRDLVLRILAVNDDKQNVLVESVMTREPITCYEADNLNKAVEAMSEYQIRRIPIIDKNEEIVGIIAQADVAIHLDNHDKVGQMIGKISQPNLESAR